MSWPLVTLGSICSPKQWPILPRSEWTPSGYPVYGANGQIGWSSKFTHDSPTVLVACRGTCGAIQITSGRTYVNGNAMALDGLDSSRLDFRYLARFLAWRGLDDVVTGSSQPQITRQNLTRVEVPLPPLPEQRRVAAILDQADELRASQLRARVALNELERAHYLRTIGDPAVNPHGWRIKRLDQLGQIVTGNTPKRSETSAKDALEWIKSTNILTNSPLLTEADEWLSGGEAKLARQVPAGSILVTCIAGSAGSIGNSALADRRVAFNQQINAFVPSTYPPLFALAHMRAVKPFVQAASTGGMKGLVSKSRFQSIEVPDPPSEVVASFEKAARKARDVRSSLQAQGSKLEELFVSLQAEAFAQNA